MDAVMHGRARILRGGGLLVGTLVLLLAASCGKKSPAPSVAEPEWLARVNGERITEEDVQFEVQRRLASKRPVGDPQAILQELIQRRVMLQEARKSEHLHDPAVQRELENRELGQWLDRTLQVMRDGVRVTDDDLRAHYDSNLAGYTRPEMVRLAVLFRRVQARDPDAQAEALREELEKARAAFLADPAAATQQGRIPGFGTVAAEYSEDTISRYRGGDLGWIEVNSAEHRHPDAVLKAGLALELGAVSEVMAAGDGLYVVMKTGLQPAEVTSFEEVAPVLRRRLIRQRQEEIERSFASNLMAAARIEIDSEKASQLAIPMPETPEPPELRSPAEWRPEQKPPAP
ncbi:MAG TPA: peptidyl-prolyl cis-trans isomerase [Kiritimatiellia bacterium]|nr:peptidyl-prolyl cis-trans isomerase [Kiritimatiellia bacterium]